MQQQDNFYGMGIAPKILEVLDKLKFKVPTPIQHKAIPIALEGKDLIGIAQTGTGKTLAFGIPILQQIAKLNCKALIMLPTRELAIQVEETLQKLGRTFGLKTVILIGGAPIGPQIRSLKKNPHVIVGTPGRITDHLKKKVLRLDAVRILVLDEADRMLDMGFAPQIAQVIKFVPAGRQTFLFSATMPDKIVKLATSYMKLPVRVEIARAGTTVELVEQELFFVKKDEKFRLLDKLLTEYRGTVLVFSRTKHGAKHIRRAVEDMGHSAAEIHSNRSLAQRRHALEGFKSGKYRVLVATDIASRGIDVNNIELIINFDIPEHAEDYVHRIGRTARAGQRGRAITFAEPHQRNEVRDIERLVRIALKVSPTTGLPPGRPGAPKSTKRGGAPQRKFSSRRPSSRRSSPRKFGSNRPPNRFHRGR